LLHGMFFSAELDWPIWSVDSWSHVASRVKAWPRSDRHWSVFIYTLSSEVGWNRRQSTVDVCVEVPQRSSFFNWHTFISV